MDNLVNAINNLKINNAGSELNTAITSAAQGDLMRNPDTVTHTRNRILDQELLSCRAIGEVSVLPLPKKPRIALIELAPQTLLMSAVQEIFVDTGLGNTWKNRTPQQISRTGFDGSIPIYTPIHSGMITYDTPYSSDNDRTSQSIT